MMHVTVRFFTGRKIAELVQVKQADLQLIRGFHINAVNLSVDRDHVLLICALQAGAFSLLCTNESNMATCLRQHAS